MLTCLQVGMRPWWSGSYLVGVRLPQHTSDTRGHTTVSEYRHMGCVRWKHSPPSSGLRECRDDVHPEGCGEAVSASLVSEWKDQPAVPCLTSFCSAACLARSPLGLDGWLGPPGPQRQGSLAFPGHGMNTLQGADARGSCESVLSSEAIISNCGQGADLTVMAPQR